MNAIGTRLALYFLLASTVHAQLYLIAGTPNPKGDDTFASALLRVTDEGAVSTVTDLVPQNAATELITVNYDWRKALIDSYEDGGTLTVIDFDKGAVVKKCHGRRAPLMGGIEAWLANSPSVGPAYEGESFALPPKTPSVLAMILDPAVPCDKSFVEVDPTDVRHALASGRAGVAGLAPKDGIPVAISPLPAGVEAGWRRIYFDAPARMTSGFNFAAMEINDSHVAVLMLANTQYQHSTILLRKSDNSWRILPFPTEFSTVRGFGRFIGITEVQPKSDRYPKNPGDNEWPKGRSATGPNRAEWFRGYQISGNHIGILPGRLYVYDTDTEKMYPIITNQADSEILLVDNQIVYYRVNDRIYSATINAGSLGEPTQVAKGEPIRDAHWAFIKH